MTADVLEPRGSRLAPRFVPELERAFQARYYADIRNTLRIVAAVLAALFLLYAGRDYMDTRSVSLAARQNGVPAAFFLLLFGLTFGKNFERVWQPVVALGGGVAAALSLSGMAAFFGEGLATGTTPNPVSEGPFPGYLVFYSLQTCILMVCFAALRLLFRWALPLQIGVLTAGVWAFLTWLVDHRPDPINALSRFLQPTLLVFFAVLLLAWVQGNLARATFLAHHLLSRRSEELAAANRELTAANAALEQDLEAAARIQKALLPTTLPEIKHMRFAWAFRPCQGLAGDILNIFLLDDRHVGFYLLDVTGHGVPAALLSVTVSHFLAPEGSESLLKLGAPSRIAPPAEVAQRLNRQFSQGSSGLFFTLFYGILDLATLDLRYVNAGHPGPLILAESQPPRCLESTGLPIGVLADVAYEESVARLQPGDRVWLFSDGLPEARNPNREMFGEQRLLDALQAMNSVALDPGTERLLARIEDWAGAEGPQDDISLVAFEVVG